MGQGNAIAHLMPVPFYMYRMVVAKARAPEESIQDQIDKIPDEVVSPTNRYKIEVMPGIYPEVITMKNYVDVVAPYGRVVIQPDTGVIGVIMADNCMLQGVEVNLTTIKAGANVTGIRAIGVDNVIIEDCWVTGGDGGDIGINVTNTGTDIIVRKCRIDEVATGLFKDGTGSLWFADNRVTAFAGGIDIDINNGTLNLMDNELMCTGAGANVDVASANTIVVNSFGNTLNGDGWEIGDNTDAWVYSHNDKFTKVTHAGDGHMVATEEPQTYRVHNGMKIGDALIAIAALSEGPIDTRRFTIQVFSGEYNETVTMAQYVDLVGESNQSVVIYQANARVLNAAANSRVRSIRIELTAAEGVRCIEVDAVAARLEDCIVVVTGVSAWNHGIHTMNGGTVTLYDCHITATGTAAYALTLTNTSTSTLYNCSFSGSDDTYDIFLTSNAAVDAYNCQLLNNGWYIGDYANVFARAYACDYAEVTFEGTNGAFADLTGCRIYACASDLTIGDWVYASANDTVAETDADDLAKMPSIGVINYKPSNVTCYVKNYGYYYDANYNTDHGSLFVASEEYWISATPGEITTTMHPVWPQRAGVAVSTQRFKILVGDNLGLVHCNEYACSGTAEAVDEFVYISGADTVDEADASDGTKMPAIGVIAHKITPTTALVKLRGKYIMDGKGWTASEDVYMDPGTPGGITNLIPVGGVIQKVAEVKSDAGAAEVDGLILELAD